MCLKERLCDLLQKASEVFLDRQNKTWFAVECFIWPRDKTNFINLSSQRPKLKWMVRPEGTYRNKLATRLIVSAGNKIGDAIAQLQTKSIFKDDMSHARALPVSVVHRFVDRPFLVNSRKHTLRLYLLIKSFDPLEMYVSHSGEVIFAALPYQHGESHLNNACMQFGITSVADCVSERNVSLYWTLQHYWSVVKQTGIVKSRDFLWSKLKDVATHTGLMTASAILSFWNKTYDKAKIPGKAYWKSAYALLALEILIDESKQPWLVGIDCDPGLAYLGSEQTSSLKAK